MLFSLEQTVKGSKAAETRFHGNLHDRQLRLDQQLLSLHQPTVNQIIITGNIHDLFEKTGKMKFTEACDVGDIIQLDILGAMFVDVIAYIKKEVYVLQMLLVFQIGKFIVTMDAISPQDGEKTNKQRIYRGFPQGQGGKILRLDFMKQGCKLLVYFRHQRRRDGDAGMKHMKNRTEAVQTIQQSTVELDNDAAAGGRRKYPVHFAGGNNNDIIYT